MTESREETSKHHRFLILGGLAVGLALVAGMAVLTTVVVRQHSRLQGLQSAETGREVGLGT